jgi:hypothetical protein
VRGGHTHCVWSGWKKKNESATCCLDGGKWWFFLKSKSPRARETARHPLTLPRSTVPFASGSTDEEGGGHVRLGSNGYMTMVVSICMCQTVVSICMCRISCQHAYTRTHTLTPTRPHLHAHTLKRPLSRSLSSPYKRTHTHTPSHIHLLCAFSRLSSRAYDLSKAVPRPRSQTAHTGYPRCCRR